jgi:hypothetical protein
MIPLWLVVALAPATVASGNLPYQLVDRRQIDGSILLVEHLTRTETRPYPFSVGRTWEFLPSSNYFRVKGRLIPCKKKSSGDPPTVTFRNGEVVENSVLNAFGGTSNRSFNEGEIVRLVALNTAFNSVRMDIESICLFDRGGAVRGRAVFMLSDQVGKKTFDEANAAVVAVLEPVSLHMIARQCSPSTGLPPPALRLGMSENQVTDLLGPPEERREDGRDVVFDYGSVEIRFGEGMVTRLRIPAID